MSTISIMDCDYWKPIAPGGIALPCNCGKGCDRLQPMSATPEGEEGTALERGFDELMRTHFRYARAPHEGTIFAEWASASVRYSQLWTEALDSAYLNGISDGKTHNAQMLLVVRAQLQSAREDADAKGRAVEALNARPSQYANGMAAVSLVAMGAYLLGMWPLSPVVYGLSFVSVFAGFAVGDAVWPVLRRWLHRARARP